MLLNWSDMVLHDALNHWVTISKTVRTGRADFGPAWVFISYRNGS